MKSARVSGVDTISNLPDDVLGVILRCLSLKDAVKTSILSKKWRYKWVTRGELDFDDKFFRSWEDKQEAKKIIYQVLLLHERPILKFRLQDSFYVGPKLMSCPDIDHWILFLSKRKIQELTLHVASGDAHRLPSQLFTCQQLRHLELYNCSLHPPPGFKGFEKLVNLELEEVIFVPSLISKCPLLERLCLRWCTGFDILEIDATNLKCFIFVGLLKSICFKNAPVLREVTILWNDFSLNASPTSPVCSNFTKFFHYMPSLQELHVCCSVLEFLAIGGLPENPPTALNNVKSIMFSDLTLSTVEEVSVAVYLITSCPKLQELTIECHPEPDVFEPVAKFLEERSTRLYGAAKLLQEVDMWCYYDCAEMPMKLMKFILACAPVLVKITMSKNPLEEEMRQFPTASPDVIFKFR